MGEYRKKPVVIEAIQFTGNFFDIHEFTNGNAHDCYTQPEGYMTCIINTLEGIHVATEGDYIIKGVHGEFYPCNPDIFEKTYEVADRAKTNADRIRAMSDEELADVVANGVGCVGCVRKAQHCMDDDCTPCIKEWLQKPAEVET